MVNAFRNHFHFLCSEIITPAPVGNSQSLGIARNQNVPNKSLITVNVSLHCSNSIFIPAPKPLSSSSTHSSLPKWLAWGCWPRDPGDKESGENQDFKWSMHYGCSFMAKAACWKCHYWLAQGQELKPIHSQRKPVDFQESGWKNTWMDNCVGMPMLGLDSPCNKMSI